MNPNQPHNQSANFVQIQANFVQASANYIQPSGTDHTGYYPQSMPPSQNYDQSQNFYPQQQSAESGYYLQSSEDYAHTSGNYVQLSGNYLQTSNYLPPPLPPGEYLPTESYGTRNYQPPQNVYGAAPGSFENSVGKSGVAAKPPIKPVQHEKLAVPKAKTVSPRERKKAALEDIKLGKDFNSQITILETKLRLDKRADKKNIEEAQKSIKKDLESLIIQKRPFAKVHFGNSSISEFDFQEQRQNIYIANVRRNDETEIVTLNQIKGSIDSKLFDYVLLLTSTSVPVIQCVHKQTDIWCEINVNNKVSISTNDLIDYYLTLDPKVKTLMTVVNFWAECYDLKKAERISTHALCLLTIFYLQQNPHNLPSVYELQRDCSHKKIIDGWNRNFISQKAFKSTSLAEVSILDLFTGFLKFYSEFDYYEEVISVYYGKSLRKIDFADADNLPDCFTQYKTVSAQDSSLMLKCNASICIQDPFEHCRNLTLSVSLHSLGDFTSLCKGGSNFYVDDESELLSKLLIHCVGSSNPKQFSFELKKSISVECSNEKWFDSIKELLTKTIKGVLNCRLKVITDLTTLKASYPDFNDEQTLDNAVFLCKGQTDIWHSRMEIARKVCRKMSETATSIDQEIAVTTQIIPHNYPKTMTAELYVTIFLKKNPLRVKIISMALKDCQSFAHISHFLQVKLSKWLHIVEERIKSDSLKKIEKEKIIEKNVCPVKACGLNKSKEKTIEEPNTSTSKVDCLKHSVEEKKQVIVPHEGCVKVTQVDSLKIMTVDPDIINVCDMEEVADCLIIDKSKEDDVDIIEISEEELKDQETGEGKEGDIEDIPEDFFDDFSNEDFMDGLELETVEDFPNLNTSPPPQTIEIKSPEGGEVSEDKIADSASEIKPKSPIRYPSVILRSAAKYPKPFNFIRRSSINPNFENISREPSCFSNKVRALSVESVCQPSENRFSIKKKSPKTILMDRWREKSYTCESTVRDVIAFPKRRDPGKTRRDIMKDKLNKTEVKIFNKSSAKKTKPLAYASKNPSPKRRSSSRELVKSSFKVGRRKLRRYTSRSGSKSPARRRKRLSPKRSKFPVLLDSLSPKRKSGSKELFKGYARRSPAPKRPKFSPASSLSPRRKSDSKESLQSPPVKKLSRSPFIAEKRPFLTKKYIPKRRSRSRELPPRQRIRSRSRSPRRFRRSRSSSEDSLKKAKRKEYEKLLLEEVKQKINETKSAPMETLFHFNRQNSPTILQIVNQETKGLIVSSYSLEAEKRLAKAKTMKKCLDVVKFMSPEGGGRLIVKRSTGEDTKNENEENSKVPTVRFGFTCPKKLTKIKVDRYASALHTILQNSGVVQNSIDLNSDDIEKELTKVVKVFSEIGVQCGTSAVNYNSVGIQVDEEDLKIYASIEIKPECVEETSDMDIDEADEETQNIEENVLILPLLGDPLVGIIDEARETEETTKNAETEAKNLTETEDKTKNNETKAKNIKKTEEITKTFNTKAKDVKSTKASTKNIETKGLKETEEKNKPNETKARNVKETKVITITIETKAKDVKETEETTKNIETKAKSLKETEEKIKTNETKDKIVKETKALSKTIETRSKDGKATKVSTKTIETKANDRKETEENIKTSEAKAKNVTATKVSTKTCETKAKDEKKTEETTKNIGTKDKGLKETGEKIKTNEMKDKNVKETKALSKTVETKSKDGKATKVFTKNIETKGLKETEGKNKPNETKAKNVKEAKAITKTIETKVKDVKETEETTKNIETKGKGLKETDEKIKTNEMKDKNVKETKAQHHTKSKDGKTTKVSTKTIETKANDREETEEKIKTNETKTKNVKETKAITKTIETKAKDVKETEEKIKTNETKAKNVTATKVFTKTCETKAKDVKETELTIKKIETKAKDVKEPEEKTKTNESKVKAVKETEEKTKIKETKANVVKGTEEKAKTNETKAKDVKATTTTIETEAKKVKVTEETPKTTTTELPSSITEQKEQPKINTSDKEQEKDKPNVIKLEDKSASAETSKKPPGEWDRYTYRAVPKKFKRCRPRPYYRKFSRPSSAYYDAPSYSNNYYEAEQETYDFYEDFDDYQSYERYSRDTRYSDLRQVIGETYDLDQPRTWPPNRSFHSSSSYRGRGRESGYRGRSPPRGRFPYTTI